MSAALSWQDDGRDWPNRAASRFVNAGGLRWHVQEMGEGPDLLLLHGTGAATHSWRDLMPLLAQDFRVIAPDLPGHGFTQYPPSRDLTLPGMARALASLVSALGVAPQIVVGHSAGAAIALQMVLARSISPELVVSLNGALLPFRGLAAQLFPSLARLMALNPLLPRFFAWRAGSSGAVEHLLEGTGSRLDSRGRDLYRRLFSNREHVTATIAMMAGWNLDALGRSFGKIETPVLLIIGANDMAVPPGDATEVARRLPQARIETLKGAGHLVHEERPGDVARLIRAAALHPVQMEAAC